MAGSSLVFSMTGSLPSIFTLPPTSPSEKPSIAPGSARALVMVFCGWLMLFAKSRADSSAPGEPGALGASPDGSSLLVDHRFFPLIQRVFLFAV